MYLYEDCQDIEWRPIQHVPNEMNLANVEDMAQLASEVFTVRHREPEVAIAMLQRRPDSGPANLILIALLNQNVLPAQQFRARVFEALWAEGLDISNDEVIANLLAELGIDMPQIASNGKAQLTAFQSQWQAADPDRRIPIMTASDSRSLIGLSAPRDIE